MQDLLEQYNIIADLLDDDIEQSDIEIIESVYSENMEDLYDIAVDMYNFNQTGGNLQYDYGRGVLLEIFFDKIKIIDGSIDEVQRNHLKDMDETFKHSPGMEPYQTIEKAYHEYKHDSLQSNQSFIPIQKKTSKDKEQLHQQAIVNKNSSFTKRLEHEKIDNKAKDQTSFCCSIL